jgi:putative ABC transport system substrate-binding protein
MTEITRRHFGTALGATAAWPIAARAQQGERARRVGLLFYGAEIEHSEQDNVQVLRENLGKLGWIEGRNLRIDLRWGFGDAGRVRAQAKQLVRQAPEVIVARGGAAARAAHDETAVIPIVMAGGADPVATGLVHDIARPEGNITGFSAQEPSVNDKRLALLKEVAPHLTRVAALFNPDLMTAGPTYLPSLEASSMTLGVQITKVPFRSSLEIVRAIDAFAAEPNGGLLVMPPPPTGATLDILVQLAAQHRLPAIWIGRPEIEAGGLVSYGSDVGDLLRGAASYVDHLLRGAKVADLPVQFPTKFELLINLKTANAIGLKIPEPILLRADGLIE